MNKWSKRLFRCECDCGGEKIVKMGCLKNGYTSSCGCLWREQAIKNIPRTHEMSASREYWIWKSMKARCLNPNNASFNRYGGRGISVCERWMKFDNFYSDMGDAPSRLTLDRKDNNGNYEPGNCRWATYKQQQRNRSSNHRIAHNGTTKSMVEWSEDLGISYNTIQGRHSSGYPEQELLSPLHQGVGLSVRGMKS